MLCLNWTVGFPSLRWFQLPRHIKQADRTSVNPCLKVTDPICQLPLTTFGETQPKASHLKILPRFFMRSLAWSIAFRVVCNPQCFSRTDRRPKDPAGSTVLWHFLDASLSLSGDRAIQWNGGASTRTDNSAFWEMTYSGFLWSFSLRPSK